MLAWLLRGSPPYFLNAPGIFAHMRRRGIPTWFFCVNDENDFELACAAGATGALSDNVSWMCAHMAEKRVNFVHTV
jgi:hypothetical protein